LLEESLALSETAGDAYTLAWTSMTLGRLRLRQGDPAAAEQWFRRALAGWHGLEDIHHVPSALERLAWTAAVTGKAERAAYLLGAASQVRESLGMMVFPNWRADHERATETAKAALGERAFTAAWLRGRSSAPGQAVAYALSTESASGVLSERQREIVRLIAAGRHNRQISVELGVSERTVEWHVSNILDKLGASSRSQIANWAVEQGLLGDQLPTA
jgi:DNA-binding CsgD family transcriptional regulator